MLRLSIKETNKLVQYIKFLENKNGSTLENGCRFFRNLTNEQIPESECRTAIEKLTW